MKRMVRTSLSMNPPTDIRFLVYESRDPDELSKLAEKASPQLKSLIMENEYASPELVNRLGAELLDWRFHGRYARQVARYVTDLNILEFLATHKFSEPLYRDARNIAKERLAAMQS